MIYLLHLDYLVSVVIGLVWFRRLNQVETRSWHIRARVENMRVGRGVCQSVCLVNDAKWSCDGSRVGRVVESHAKDILCVPPRRRASTLIVVITTSRIPPTFAITVITGDRAKTIFHSCRLAMLKLIDAKKKSNFATLPSSFKLAIASLLPVEE